MEIEPGIAVKALKSEERVDKTTSVHSADKRMFTHIQ